MSMVAPEFIGSASVAEERTAPRWMWLVPLVLIVATEYKFRKRDINDALSGSLDVFVMIELFVYALAGLVVYAWLVRGRVRWVPITVVMLGYAATTAASALYAPFPQMAMARGVQLLIVALMAIAFASMGDRRTLGTMVDAYIVLITASIVVGLAYVAPVTNVQRGRFTWLFTHSVDSAALMAVSVVLLVATLLGTDGALGRLPGFIGRRWRWFLLAFQIVFLLRNQTRASAAAAVIGCLVVVWLRVSRRFRPHLVAAVLVAGAAVLLTAGGAIMSFVLRGEDAAQIGTFNRRTEIWVLAWRSFLSHPLDGLGFTAARGVFYDEVAQAGQKGLGGGHNAFVEVITDVGIIGLVWWLTLILLIIGATVRLHRRLGPSVDVVAPAGVMGCLLVNSITIEGLGTGVSGPAITLFLLGGWVCIERRSVAAWGGRTMARLRPRLDGWPRASSGGGGGVERLEEPGAQMWVVGPRTDQRL